MKREAEVSHLMRCLTRALYRIKPEGLHGGFLGGQWGYGVEFETPVFEMFPFYWGDCTCGFEERWEEKERAWSVDHPHAPHCYQTELRARIGEYDRQSGYATIEAAAFGGAPSLFGGFNESVEDHGNGVVSMLMTTREDDAMEAWRTAHDAKRRFEGGLYKELCAKYGQSEFGCAVHCTCGRDKLYEAFAKTDSHDPRCPIIRPNFLHKPSGATVEWYKYIGRGMEIKAPKRFDWCACMRECIASARSSEIGGKKHG